MSRTLKQQFSYCLHKCDHRGSSKRADRKNGATENRIYSCQRMGDLTATAEQFSKFMKQAHPEVKMVDQIRSEHVQEYIESKRTEWSSKTEKEMISRLHKLNTISNHVYGRSSKWSMHATERMHQGKVRDKAMTRKDFESISTKLSQGRSEAKHAMEITGRCGLRVAEVAGLKVSGIDTKTWKVEVREGAKNGNYRDVAIRPRDRPYFARLKAECEARGRDYVCNGVKSTSLDRAIRREMKTLGLNDRYPKTTDHAIRKMWARERMEEERASGKSERDAWQIVQKELGHGESFRQALYETYIGGRIE